MAREGGSYIKEQDGSLTLVHRTQPTPPDSEPEKPTEQPAAPETDEVNTDEDA